MLRLDWPIVLIRWYTYRWVRAGYYRVDRIGGLQSNRDMKALASITLLVMLVFLVSGRIAAHVHSHAYDRCMQWQWPAGSLETHEHACSIQADVAADDSDWLARW